MTTAQRLIAHPSLFLAALILAELVAAFEAGMIWAAVRVLQEQLGSSVLVGWVISSYYLVAAGAAVLGARLGDMFGRRRVLIYVLLIAALGSLLCALFPDNLTMLLIGRGIQGVSAAILPLCFGLAREFLPQHRVMTAIGLLAGTIGLATGAGLLLGGVIVDYFQWHWIFYASVIVALLALVGALMWIPYSPPSHDGSRIDLVGGVLFPPGVVLILFANTQARFWGWDDLRIWGLLILGVLLIGYWVAYELRHRNPLINVRLFMNRQLSLNLLCMVLTCAAFQTTLVLSMLVQAPTWTGLGLGLGATVVGGLSLLAQVVGMMSGLWAARLVRRESARYAIVLGGSIAAATWLVMTFSFSQGYFSLWLAAACFLGYGLGATLVFAVVPMAVVEVVPAERTSEATGVVSVVRQVFLGLFTQVVTGLLALSTVQAPDQPAILFPSSVAFTVAAGFIALCSLLIVVVALGLRGRQPGMGSAAVTR